MTRQFEDAVDQATEDSSTSVALWAVSANLKVIAGRLLIIEVFVVGGALVGSVLWGLSR